ncbi:uncharacterized protein HMPREF1541_09712 [Cyphellophora europaea CBS 101466]|uniref:TRAM domain-containing protein n=1 Tax=Cyphellophora europaea (strain CBS 101466) TaxID=1220924 RepID=W2S833_CYPE1|nr:uncharacterized protein HMPREF1541_09712 [Cyphellophora europaea CBS 101466]ETN44837.1 hypothetical protein HMPREF1541_09712 [Cyphellophora europaea CBS 101466]
MSHRCTQVRRLQLPQRYDLGTRSSSSTTTSRSDWSPLIAKRETSRVLQQQEDLESLLAGHKHKFQDDAVDLVRSLPQTSASERRNILQIHLKSAEHKLHNLKTATYGAKKPPPKPEWYIKNFSHALNISERSITILQHVLNTYQSDRGELQGLLKQKYYEAVADIRAPLARLDRFANRAAVPTRPDVIRATGKRDRLKRELASVDEAVQAANFGSWEPYSTRSRHRSQIRDSSKPEGLDPYADATEIAMAKQAWIDNDRRQKRRKVDHKPPPSSLDTCGTDDVLRFEVKELLGRPRPTQPNDHTQVPKVEDEPDSGNAGEFREIVLLVEELSATGEGLARHPTSEHVYVVPFTLPGEKVIAKAPRRAVPGKWSHSDLVEVLTPSSLREGITPKCKYFGECSGCQLQMIPYSEQLIHKKTIVEKAYRNFSGLASDQLPAIDDTGSSPLQYGYRTKLTPHFDGPRRNTAYTATPPIGFTRKGFRQVMDIESCPIGTPILQEGLSIERAKVAANIGKYKRGATILLRETTRRSYNEALRSSEPAGPSCDSPLPPLSLESIPPPDKTEIKRTSTGPVSVARHTISTTEPPTLITDTKTYTTDSTTTSIEQIGAYTFSTRAGSFFQNNNSILPSFLSHVRSLIQPASPTPKLKYLLDAYCGSGLFALTLSPLFTSVLGIELDPHGVTSARANAAANNITNAGFIEADAAALFADVPFPAAQTCLVIDPPRKGCSVDFLRQLLRYGPARVCYVSCNVGSQARDVGCLVRGYVGEGFWRAEGEGNGGMEVHRRMGGVEVGKYRYEVEELQGWDFFPQTGHVEGLCVLKRVENEKYEEQKRRFVDGDVPTKGEGDAADSSKPGQGLVNIVGTANGARTETLISEASSVPKNAQGEAADLKV